MAQPAARRVRGLRDRLEALTAKKLAEHCDDVMAMRRDYIRLIHDHNSETVNAFLDKHLKPGRTSEVRAMALDLMESLSHSMLTFTSCGWFFGEVSRLEPVQNMKYALRAVDFAQKYTEEDLLRPMLEKLAEARSNIPSWTTGSGSSRTSWSPQGMTCSASWRRTRSAC